MSINEIIQCHNNQNHIIPVKYHLGFIRAVFNIKPGPILETKGMRVTFQKKGKKGQKMFKKGKQRTKYLKIWVKMYKI